MQEQLITVETKQLMQQKDCNLVYCKCGGFPECICGDDLKLIPQSLLQKWLREVHNIYVTSFPSYSDNTIKKERFFFEISFSNKLKQFGDKYGHFKTYEDALEAGLIESLKMIKDENN